MLRIILLIIANFSLLYTDFSSGNIIQMILLPLIDLAFTFYIFFEIGTFISDNINHLIESIRNPFVDMDWQNPHYWLQYTVEFLLWCAAFAQFMFLFKKAISS